MASNDNVNFINYKDFDVKNLSLNEGKVNKGFGYRTFEIKYEYPDGKLRDLRLRSPVLFSYRIKKYENSPDYFMSLRSFYDEKNPREKEISFKKTLNDISEFLREKLRSLDRKIDREDLKNMEILNDKKIFFPKLRQNKIFKNNKFTRSEISAVFYEKKENGRLEEIDPITNGKNCEVIAYIDISDIFVKGSLLKVRTYITDVIVIKEDVPPPKNYEKTTGVRLDSDDKK